MQIRRLGRAGLVLALGMLQVCCSASRPPVVAGALPGGLDAFLAGHPLAPGQALRLDEVGRTASASWHVAQVRGAETPHRHRAHDLAVFVLRGEGVFTLDGRPTTLRPGDAALVPRDRVHWFARRGNQTAVSLVVFTPPLDAPDLVPEPGVDTMGEGR